MEKFQASLGMKLHSRLMFTASGSVTASALRLTCALCCTSGREWVVPPDMPDLRALLNVLCRTRRRQLGVETHISCSWFPARCCGLVPLVFSLFFDPLEGHSDIGQECFLFAFFLSQLYFFPSESGKLSLMILYCYSHRASHVHGKEMANGSSSIQKTLFIYF